MAQRADGDGAIVFVGAQDGVRIVVQAARNRGKVVVRDGCGLGVHDVSFPPFVGICRGVERRCGGQQLRDSRERDRQPVGPVLGLVAGLVQGLIEFEGREQFGVVGRVRYVGCAVSGKEGLARALPPLLGGGIGGGGRVVEGAQHAGDIAQRQVQLGAFGEGAQGLTLEIEQHPAALGGLEYLAEVQVAVDALQSWPGPGGCGREQCLDLIGVRRELGNGLAGGLVPLAPRGRDLLADFGRRALRGHDLAKDAVHVRAGAAEGLGGEILPGRDRLQRLAPRVGDAGQKLLSDGQVTGGARAWRAIGRNRLPAAREVALGRGHAFTACGAERAGDNDVGVFARGHDPENLDDHPFVVLQRDDERGVGLFGRNHAGVAHGSARRANESSHERGGEVRVIDRVIQVARRGVGRGRIVKTLGDERVL